MLKKLFIQSLLKVVCTTILFFNFSETSYLKAKSNCASACSTDVTNFIEPLQSGLWQDATIWPNGTLPALSDEVSIPSNMVIELSGLVEAKIVEVHGTLKAVYQPISDAWIDMTTKAIHVLDGGHLEIGTANNPYHGECLITLIGNDPNETICPAMGVKFIGAMSGGTINMHGKAKTSWTQLDTTASVGASQITLKEPVNWEVGDEIVIASSRIGWFEAEQKTITAISSDSVLISFGDTLVYPHIGAIKNYTRDTDGKTWEADLRAEVGLLSHNIKIQGDDFSEANGFGGHIMIHGEAKAYVSGVELYRMGQKSLLGTYPFHWHRVGSHGNGQYFKNSSVHVSYNKGITIHATESTLVDNNFFFDHIGHGIYLEDGCERFNTITNNLVMLSRKPVIGEEATPSEIFGSGNSLQDRSPSSFWISNPNNTFENNVAAGTAGTGYWFAFPVKPMGPSATDPRFQNQQPFKEPLGLFNNNKAHSCGRGFDIFDGMTTDHHIDPNEGWKNGQINHITNCTWYANDLAIYTGINNGVTPDNLIFQNNTFVENEVAVMFASYSLANDCLFASNSEENLLSGKRYLYRVYDGAGRIENSHFVGWDQLNSNFLINTGAAFKHVNHLFKNITKDHVAPMRMELPNLDTDAPSFVDANNVSHPRYWSLVLSDIDGSIGGKANTSIICNHPFVLTGGEYQAAEWTNTYRSDYAFALALVNYSLPSSHNPNVTISRTKPGTPTEAVYYINGYKEHHQLPFIVNEDFLYNYQYESLPASKLVRLNMDDAKPGDSFLTRFVDFGKLGGLNITSSDQQLTEYNNLDDLKASVSSGYYIEPDGNLYLHTVATGKLQKFDIRWTSDIILPVLDFDGDGSSDGYEAEQARDPFDESDLASQFNTNNDFENWNDSIIDITNLQVNGGSLKGIVDSLGSARITKKDYAFRADSVKTIIVSMKASQNTTATLYWNKVNGFSFEDSVSMSANYTANGNTQILAFEVSNHLDWNGIIQGLQFKPAEQANTTFEIDYIKTSDENNDFDGDGYTSKTEKLINRDPFNASDLCFDFSTNNEGWFKAGTTDNECLGCDGGWSVESNGSDPQIIFSNFNFSSNRVSKIYVDVKSAIGGKFRLFWTTTLDGGFSASKRATVNYSNPDRQVLVFNLENQTGWANKTITQLRLDPIGGEGETVFYGICATELCYPHITDFVSSIATTGETCNNADGDITIMFNDNPYKTGIQFSLDGGLTYKPMVNDTTGSVMYNNLSAGNYALYARWNDGSCEENIANQTVQKDPIKEVFVSSRNASCAGNDGTFTFVFFDNPLQTHIEFSFDNGASYQPAVRDDVGITTYGNMPADTYIIKARWADGSCVENLGTYEIRTDISPMANVVVNNATCEQVDGSITFLFPDEPSHHGVEFSLDGGLNYQAAVNDTLGTVTYSGLMPNTYPLKVRWADGTCEVDLGQYSVEADPLPSANVSHTNETCAQNDGSISITFPDQPNQNNIAFSIDGGISFFPEFSDTLETAIFKNLSDGTYRIYASFENGLCPTNLNTQITISAEADTDSDGVCDLEDSCAGFDDNSDDDSDNIPDGCDPCTNYWEDLSLGNLATDHTVKIEVNTNCTVSNGTNVKLNAGETISLSNGFSVEVGADFEANIQSCVD